jgi:uncharacterized membrane protein YfbV (UPF0208 family)
MNDLQHGLWLLEKRATVEPGSAAVLAEFHSMSARLETIQQGLDAIDAMPEQRQWQLREHRAMLRREKAALEQQIPFSEWPVRGYEE